MPVETPQIEEPVYGGGIATGGATQQQAAAASAPMASGSTPQALPPGAGYVSKGGAAAYVANSIIDGWLKGRHIAQVRNMQTAQNEIGSWQHVYDVAKENYKNVAEQKGENSEEAKKAYAAAQTAWGQYTNVREKYMIPQDQGKKGAGKSKGEQFKGALGNWAGQMFGKSGVTPHLVAAQAIQMAKQLPPEGLALDQRDRLDMEHLKQAQGATQLQQAELAKSQERQKWDEEDEARKEQERKVEEAGGFEAVLAAGSNASPELQTAARRMKYSALDQLSPEGKLKMGFYNDVLTGASAKWTPEQRVLAGELCAAPKPIPIIKNGAGGHRFRILVDPTTNQPIPGSKPLDLGMPEELQQYYAKRSQDHAEITRAVESDPAASGVALGNDPAQNKARIAARIAQLQVSADFGIETAADRLGKTGFEVQRDNAILSDVVKAAGLGEKPGKSILDTGGTTITIPGVNGGKPFAVGPKYFQQIFSEFAMPRAENSGVYAFRDVALNPDNKTQETLEAERQFFYNWVMKQMTAGKGRAMSPDDARTVLGNTALGKPLTGVTENGNAGASGGAQPAAGGAAQGGGDKPLSQPPGWLANTAERTAWARQQAAGTQAQSGVDGQIPDPPGPGWGSRVWDGVKFLSGADAVNFWRDQFSSPQQDAGSPDASGHLGTMTDDTDEVEIEVDGKKTKAWMTREQQKQWQAQHNFTPKVLNKSKAHRNQVQTGKPQ